MSLNENWDEDVRADMSDALDRIAPEDKKGELYRHSAEGLDDMPVSCSFPTTSLFFFLFVMKGEMEIYCGLGKR